MRPPYFVIVENEECAAALREYISNRAGRNYVRRICGVDRGGKKWKLVASTIIIADKDYSNVVAAARAGYTARYRARVKKISVKIPRDMYEAIEEVAAGMGVSFSEAVRKY